MDFQRDVIERSREIPVLVDFWAPWCGPCRILGPVLDDLAEEAGGKWELVKLNTEEHPDIARQYHIMTIPNVKLFSGGEVIGEFMGALPKTQVQHFLAEKIPSPADRSVEEIMRDNTLTLKEKARRLEAVYDVYPDEKGVGLAIALHSAFHHPGRATDLVSDVKMSDPAYATATLIRDIAEFMSLSVDGVNPFEDDIRSAQGALQQEDWESGIKTLINLTSIDKTYHDDLPRRSTIAIFNFLGPQHPVTKKYRKMFDMVLW
jgi:putative thioredoxin